MNKLPLPNSLAEDYDLYPYPVLCFAQTHPDRLAALGASLELEPTPVEHCRVLELGCAVGGNIIPMAYALPNSQFVGVDISQKQIEAGERPGTLELKISAFSERQ